MLEGCEVATRIPVRDLKRARRFYSEKLGLEPVEERPGGLRYRGGNACFALFESAGEASGTHTQMGWEVTDIESTVAALRARGVVFEEYDLPGLRTVNGIAEIAGNFYAFTPQFLETCARSLRVFFFLRQIYDRAIGAFLGVSNGHRAPNFAIPASDQRHLLLQLFTAAVTWILIHRFGIHPVFQTGLRLLLWARQGMLLRPFQMLRFRYHNSCSKELLI